MLYIRNTVICIVYVITSSLRHCSAHETAGLTFELPDNEEMCFYENFEGSKKYVFYYKVLQGGNYDVDVELTSPNGKTIYKEEKKESDTVVFDISWGTFKFCFSNEFSSITHKMIYFEIHPEDASELASEVGKRNPSANTHLEETMETIHKFSTKIVSYQTNYRQGEAKGRYAAEALNKRIQVWSLAQTIVILVTGMGQVFILRRFFTDTKPSQSSKCDVTFSVPSIGP